MSELTPQDGDHRKSCLTNPAEHHAVTRIIDASTNRLTEAVRVIEDYARYGLDDRHLMTLLKSIRHDVAAAIATTMDTRLRTACRDTVGDVGTEVTTAGEVNRGSLQAVVAANFGRAQQAARSLEEYLKTISAPAAVKIEQVRYRLYTLQKALLTTQRSQDVLSDVSIYVLVDGGDSLHDFQLHVNRLIEAGVDAIQLRDKRCADRVLLQRAIALSDVAREHDVLSFMNDRADLAMLAGADGVHLGQEDIDVASARRLVGTKMLVGVSTHSLTQAQRAVLDGADYIGIGPTFPSTTKDFEQFAGLQTVEQVASEISLPVFAIGGINAANIERVAQAGARRVAVSAALGAHVTDLAATVSALREVLARSPVRARC